MIELTENAASTRYVIFVNQNCSDHSGAVQRTRAKRCLLAAGPLTGLTGFVQHELYRRPASMLAHFCCFSSILRLGLVVDSAGAPTAPMEGTELAGLFRSDTSGGSITLNASIFANKGPKGLAGLIALVRAGRWASPRPYCVYPH